MKIAIQTQYYLPEMGAPQARLSELAKRIKANGHDVTIITAMPNYPKGVIHEGYGGIFMRDEVDGIEVLRTYIKPSQSAGLIPRLSSYFSFVFSSMIIGAVILPRVDYLITESPPLFLGISGYVLSRLKRARWIFNVSDLWPESAVRLGIVNEGLGLRLSTKLEEFCYKKAWLICGQSREIVSNISDRFPGVNTYRLSNGVDANFFTPAKRNAELRQHYFGDVKIAVVYAGLHGLAQGLDQILTAAEKLSERKDVGFFLFGDESEKKILMKMATDKGLKNVHFKDPVPRVEMPDILANAEIALITLKSMLPGAVPSKLYEAMASQLPVALVAEGEPAAIVRDNQAGKAVNFGAIDELVNVLEAYADNDDLRREHGMAGRKTVEHDFNRDKIAREFIELLESKV